MRFPSAEWFEALQEQAAGKADRFKKLGFIDAVVGVQVDPDEDGAPAAGYVLEFSGYGCKKVTPAKQPGQVADFVIEGKQSTWKEMIENIRRNGEADLQHTLNVLTLPGVPMKLEAADQLKADLFFRYNESLQEFFNGAAEIETEFAA